MQTIQEPKVSRRGFLKASAIVGGGWMIGFNLFTSCASEAAPAIDVSQLNFNDFNAFIKIADNGIVTIFSPNPEIGQGVKTSMPMIIAEELDVEWQNVHVVQAGLDTENFTRQVAGGSQSIRKSWDALRQTGATARQMLINAAATKWAVSPDSCSASAGFITNEKGEKMGYGEVVKEAAILEIPENIQLKDPKNFTIIGKDAANVDLPKIVTGESLFGIDYREKDMVFAAMRRPEAFGSTLNSFDATASKSVKGVIQVIQVGDKIAVIATNSWAAMQGCRQLHVEWNAPSRPENSSDHDAELEAILSSNKMKVRREDGHIKKAFAQADEVVERTYHAPFLPHNCLEPMNFFADVSLDKARLVGPIQTPEWTQSRLADLLGLDKSTITIEMTRMGGGFGRRLYGDFALEAAEISQKINKPVKLVFSREDDMTAGTYRPASKYRIAASIKDGKLTGFHLKEAAINGNMFDPIPNYFPADAIANYKVEAGQLESEITTGAWRAPYTNFLAFAQQSFFDELAEKLGKDPLQWRIEMLENVDDNKAVYAAKKMQSCIRLAAEKVNWGKPPEGTYQGFSAYFSHNTPVAEIAEITLNNGVPVLKRVVVAVDCGIVVNPTGAKNQIEGGVIDGIGHAMYGKIKFSQGRPSTQNFGAYRLIRMNETPVVETYFVESNTPPTGLGEPGLPPAGGAIANAIYAATRQRLLKQPFVDALTV